ncbi:tyrosine--tRNA ligase, mitochondrial [Cephus cinctus]|uniref:Tyrosine--tRNA ligase n=1 Tax=Cephus cinctus TaxID=211228 RepID=A0AAJ7FJZ2_CEPCN|nr:tyrosine--tRNA ligase, mitochondrial [Cephus cinctus]
MYSRMNAKYLVRLCSTGKATFYRPCRFYSNRNILKLYERGMFQDMFPDTSAQEIVDLLNKSPQCVYAGFDPTAESLHVGNLLVLMNLLHWQRSGHQVIALIGGATGLIGDPSHRLSERVEMNKLLVEDNVRSIMNNIQTLFENHKKFLWNDKQGKLKPVILVNNIKWYSNLNVIDFVRTVGKWFRLGSMLSRSSVQSRLNSDTGMSFTEFTYQVFQAYDWLHLLKNYDCRFQIGGNDQMGNINSGHDLIFRSTHEKVYGLTLPLITTEGGQKFGKSSGNAVWLSKHKSSSFQLYQFFIRSKDADVEQLLKFFTFLSLGEIKDLMQKHVEHPEKREAQRILAEQVTLLVHGEDGLEAARRTTAVLYDNSIESLAKMTANDLIQVFDGAPVIEILPEPGITAYDLAIKAKCFKTDKDAMRIMAAGGFSINQQKITNISEVITPGIHVLPNNLTLIRVGKKNYHIVKWLA